MKSENAWVEIIFHARLGSIPVEKVQTHTNIFYQGKKMNDVKNTFFISCIHIFQTEEKALLFLLIAMSSVKQSGAFFPSPDSCFAMLRKLQKILTRLFGKPHNNVIASQYKYRTKIHLPIFITRSLWIKHVWLLKYLITIHVFY